MPTAKANIIHGPEENGGRFPQAIESILLAPFFMVIAAREAIKPTGKAPHTTSTPQNITPFPEQTPATASQPNLAHSENKIHAGNF